MSFPSADGWNCRSGFGICLRHTMTFSGTAVSPERRPSFQRWPRKGGAGGGCPPADSRIDAPPPVRFHDAVDRDQVGRLAHVDLLLVVHRPDRIERPRHDPLELLV